MEERDYFAWISTIENMYFDKLNRTMRIIKSAKEFYNASDNKLMSIEGIDEKQVKLINEAREKFETKKFHYELQEKNINFVSICDENFPNILKKYEHCPYYLFYRGNLPDKNKLSVAMVGARACSNYGRTMAKTIAADLSNSQVQIISGMARGIDTYSQLGAINGKTPTFAILGCGCDICYPTENIELYNNILNHGGGIISEYPPGTSPLQWHFPQRNRIISGLSNIIAVIEAREKSGSLITVEWALEQGKDIYALPGRVDDNVSKGCNRLIKNGASILTCAKDILEDMNLEVQTLVNNGEDVMTNEDETTKLIYSKLNTHPVDLSELVNLTGLSADIVMEKLIYMQLNNLVEQPYMNMYVRKFK